MQLKLTATPPLLFPAMCAKSHTIRATKYVVIFMVRSKCVTCNPVVVISVPYR